MLQDQLDDRLAELYDFIQNAPIGVHVVKADGTIHFANGADLAIAGYDDAPEGYVGHHIAEFHSEQAVIEEMLDRLSSGQPLINHPAVMKRADGQTIPVVVYSSPRFEDGQFVNTRCFTFPETGALDNAPVLRDAAESLRGMSSQERGELFDMLDDVFENAPVALHIVGPDGLVRRANRLELESMGYDDSPEAYIGHHIAEFHAEEAVIEEMLDRLVGGRPLVDYPAVLVRRDGERAPVVIYSSPRFEDGQFVNTRCFTFAKMVDTMPPRRSFSWPRNDDDNDNGPAAQKTDPLTIALKRLAGRRTAEEALGFLAEMSKALAAMRNYADAAREACQLSVPFLADWCAIELASEDEARLLAVARADGITGSDELVRASAAGHEPREGASDAVCLPFATLDGADGALLLVRAGGRPAFGPADLALAEEVARRVAAAIEAGQLRERVPS
jgi:PAS domain S-box-containing protein